MSSDYFPRYSGPDAECLTCGYEWDESPLDILPEPQ